MAILPVNPPPGPPAGEPAPGPFQDDSDGDMPVRTDEPTEAELCGLWPDPFAGPPDDADVWLAELSAAEMDAIFGSAADPGPEADAEGLAGSSRAGFAGEGPHDELRPGPLLAALSQDVLDAGLGPLSDDELVGVLRASQRLSSWQAAVEFATVSELDARRERQAERPGWSRISEHTGAELAAALVLTSRSADALLGTSRNLSRLPMVLKALSEGRIDRARALVFAHELAALGDRAAAAIALGFCDIAGSMTTSQLRAVLRSMVLSVDPGALRRRAEKARAHARVETWPEGSGNAALAGRELPPAEVIAADRRIAAIARALKQAGATGTMDQLRAAVFAALLTGRDPDSLLPGRDPESQLPGHDPESQLPGHRPDSRRPPPAGGLGGLTGSVNLTMPLSAWLGDCDAPGEVASLGPLDADSCRELTACLAAGAGTRWCVTLIDRDGGAAAHACASAGSWPGSRRSPPVFRSRSSPSAADLTSWLGTLAFAWLERGICGHAREISGYRPGRTLANLVRIRQRTCGFPGCRRPAAACDNDHTTPHDQGGRTCECNLAPLCRRHHRAKQAPGWTLAQPEPGTLVWTAPHGRSYTVTPDPYPA